MNRLPALILALSLSGCANVSIRNYKDQTLKENERTIVGSFEVINEMNGEPVPECKLTFVLPNGKDTRRYFAQREDEGIVLTWMETGTVKIGSVDCGDGSFGLDLREQNYTFEVEPKSSVTYFGHVRVNARFSGISDTSGAVALGAVGTLIAGASRTNEFKALLIEDRWKTTEPVFRRLAPKLEKSAVKKSLARPYSTKVTRR